MTRLTNKTIWITGASSGIGESLALELASKKNNLIISARNTEKLEQVKVECERQGSKCYVAPIDLADPDSIDKTADEVLKIYPDIDMLINNGGVSQRSMVHETPVAIDRKIMEVNFFGQVILTKKVLPQMIAKKQGHLVVTSSIVGKFGFPLRSTYSASKHALQGFFETLKIEQKINRIKVSIIIPGRVNTNISLYAIKKDGNMHGKMDEGLDAGMDVKRCAKKLIKGLEKNKYEILVGGKEILMVRIRKYFKGLFFRIASNIKPT